MFCPKCGAKTPDDSMFCMECGAKLDLSGAGLPPESSQSNVTKQTGGTSENVPPKKKKTRKLPIIIGIIVLLAVILVVVSSMDSGTDYVATAKAHKPFAKSQNLPYTYAEVFDKYIDKPVWYMDSEDKKTDTAIVKVDGTLKGTEYSLIMSIEVSPNPDDPDGCLIRPQSVSFDGTEFISQNDAVEFLCNMFVAYDEGYKDLSGLLSSPGTSDKQGNTELSETYTKEVPSVETTPNEYVLGVKGGTNSAYPGVTYGEAFENFFFNPSWQYFVGTQEGPDEDGDGEPDYTVENTDVVEFTGDCLYADVEVTALIQFVLDNEAGTFQPVYLSFNEVPQNMLMLSELMDTVFSQAMEDFDVAATTTPAPTPVPTQSSASNEPTQDTPTPSVNTPTPTVPKTDQVFETQYYTLTIPASWEGRYEYEKYDNTLTFYERESYQYGYGGRLFSVSVEMDDSFRQGPDYSELGAIIEDWEVSPPFVGYAVVTYPTDVQFSQDTEEAYHSMSEEIETILSSFTPAEGYRMIS